MDIGSNTGALIFFGSGDAAACSTGAGGNSTALPSLYMAICLGKQVSLDAGR